MVGSYLYGLNKRRAGLLHKPISYVRYVHKKKNPHHIAQMYTKINYCNNNAYSLTPIGKQYIIGFFFLIVILKSEIYFNLLNIGFIKQQHIIIISLHQISPISVKNFPFLFPS